MIQVTCDRCGKDCGLNAYAIRVVNIHNPCPSYPRDTGDPCLSDSNERCQFILCQHCYRKLGLPNLYEMEDTREIRFRNLEVDTDE